MNIVKYLSVQEVADSWGITKRRVQNLCVNERISGAVRIGNMWAIPSDASKPKDARIRKQNNEKINPTGVLMRKARKELKSLVDTAINELEQKGLSPVNSVQTLVVFFSSKLLDIYINNPQVSLNACERFFAYNVSISISENTKRSIEKYILKNRRCLDDSLSWVYQLGNSKLQESKYKDTQFFTEKYMIKTLLDSLRIDLNSKIIDPACGGGNFLLYSLDYLVNNDKKDANIDDVIQHVLNNLYGYEIDSFLAFVSSFNLKMKALELISKKHDVTLDTFNSCSTNIFYPQQDSIAGFLDVNWSKQIIINCNNGKEMKLINIFDEINIVVTNPPFRTIKGMPSEQKEYLQKHYPMAKCDMCNAFIERIMDILPKEGKAAMVTQTSWMYLDSFTSLRNSLLKKYTVDKIWELGSNAFYDLAGEKANVALVILTKEYPKMEHRVEQYFMRNMDIEKLENVLENQLLPPLAIKQNDILKNTESRFDMISTEHLKQIQFSCEQYKDYAVPMQGTSTGDAKTLIDFFWKHIGDEDWVLVSKGGSYSRYEGLNSYCVKWGKEGEYIKNTKGSAIRNANYFGCTQLVFSDTGTAGLNVRILMPKQIFVASGPGIRINKGKILSHLAFLNSQFAAFYVRLFSPKLTIAAGYIGQIPVTSEILYSSVLEKCGKMCLISKAHRLSKRPSNIEFTYIKHMKDKEISDIAKLWFIEDLADEWTQLLNEQKIEEEIENKMRLTPEDRQAINNYIGEKIVFSTGSDDNYVVINESELSGVLGFDCFPKRTKANKKALGSDGLIEFISKAKGIPCETAYSVLLNRYALFKNSYINLYMHALVLSAMHYKERKIKELAMDSLIPNMGEFNDSDISFAKKWIETCFNDIHNGSFEGRPLFKYDPVRKVILRVEE